MSNEGRAGGFAHLCFDTFCVVGVTMFFCYDFAKFIIFNNGDNDEDIT